MKHLAILAGAVAFAGCAQVDQGVDLKRQANDLQVRVWLLESCDLSLAGVRRADMTTDFRAALLEFCLAETAPNE